MVRTNYPRFYNEPERRASYEEPIPRADFFDEKKAQQLEKALEKKKRQLAKKKPPKPPKPPQHTGQLTTIEPDKAKPQVSSGTIAKVFGKTLAPFIATVLSPSEASDATYDPGPYFWQNSNFHRDPNLRDMAVGYVEPIIPMVDVPVEPKFDIPVRPTAPEIPWKEFKEHVGDGYTRSPKKGTIVINVPDIMVPPPLTLEPFPELFPDTDVRYENPFPNMVEPEIDFDAPEISVNPPRTGQRNRLGQDEVVIEIETKPETETQPEVTRLTIRSRRVKASQKRRKETKAGSKWIKAANKLISNTYGEYSEMIDLMEVISFNAYKEVKNKDGEIVRIPAVALEDGSLLKVMQGIGRGEYEFDIGKFIIDFTVMQATDALIGKVNQKIVKDLIDTGIWQSAAGPSSSINRATGDFANVSSQYVSN